MDGMDKQGSSACPITIKARILIHPSISGRVSTSTTFGRLGEFSYSTDFILSRKVIALFYSAPEILGLYLHTLLTCVAFPQS